MKLVEDIAANSWPAGHAQTVIGHADTNGWANNYLEVGSPAEQGRRESCPSPPQRDEQCTQQEQCSDQE